MALRKAAKSSSSLMRQFDLELTIGSIAIVSDAPNFYGFALECG